MTFKFIPPLVTAVAVLGFVAAFAPTATARTYMASSQRVALIQKNGPVPPAGQNGLDGIMPVSSHVYGRTAESFNKFSFRDLALSQITTAALAKFDTVALIQVKTADLTSAAQAALAHFVANGGKLIIHDADETLGNDYSWLLPGTYSTRVGASCNGCGLSSGMATITEKSGLISANPSDATYVDLGELARFTDAIGDANLLVSNDPRWYAATSGTNGKGESGAQVAHASHNGLIIYNGFDTDVIKPSPTAPWRCINPPSFTCPNGHPSVDWLAQMWYSELNKSWNYSSNGLPTTNPLNGIGRAIPAFEAGLPSAGACVAKRKMFLRLRRLTRHHRIIEVDVYVNGKRVRRELGSVTNVTLAQLPQKRPFTVKVVATTKRGYHLISKGHYTAC